MWYDYTVTVAPTEVVTIGQARIQARTEAGDGHDDELTALITASRGIVQKVTGLLIGSQTVVVKCDSFEDMCRLPIAPVTSVTSIVYLDTDGATQTLATSVYELRAESLDPAIVLKFNQSWPSIQSGSRITLTAVAGSATPDAPLVHAMLLKIAELFGTHETVDVGGMTTFDALLFNYRRNA
jgi:uncharacterized phiE125 gp8 family phage protein